MFTTPFDVRILGDQKFELLAPLKYEDDVFSIEVLPGFIFNGGSIPDIFRGLECPIGGVGSKVFCIHDVLYATHFVGRYEADRILYRALIEQGMSRAIAISFYLSVRAFGDISYNRPKPDKMYWEFINITSKKDKG